MWKIFFYVLIAYLVLLLIPAWIIFFVRKKKIFKELGRTNYREKDGI